MHQVTLPDSRDEFRYPVSVDQRDEDGLSQLKRELLDRKVLLASLGLLGAILGFLAWSLIPERFTATAMVLVQPLNTNLPGVTALGPQENGNALIRSEAALINSPSVLWEGVARLANDPIAIELVQPTASDRITLGICSLLPASVREVTWVRRLCASASGDVEAAKTAGLTGQVTPQQELVDRLEDRLDVDYNNADLLLHISLWAYDPGVAAHAVNTFVETYIDEYRARQRGILSHINTLSERVAALQRRLQEAEYKVNAFRREHRLVQRDGGSITDQQLAEMNAQLSVAQGELAASQALYSSALQAASATRLGELVDSQTLLQLRDREAELAQKSAHLASDLGKRHPQILSVKEELRSMQESIRRETKRVLNGLATDVKRAQERVHSLRNGVATLQAQVVGDTDAYSRLRELEREAQSTRTVFEQLLASYEHARSLNEGLTSITLVSPAKPPVKPSNFSPFAMAVIGALGGLIMGLLFVLLRHYRDAGFHSVEDAGRAVGVGNVISIHYDRHALGRLSEITLRIAQAPNSALSESIRGLRSQMLFAAEPDQGARCGKTIIVTSSLSGEGKSSLALALAATSAIDGFQVLLLECDLRCATIGEAFGSHNLKDGIDMKDAGQPWASELIVDPYTSAHLRLVKTPTNLPHRYLQSNVIDPLLEYCKLHYDLIVIDTPPIMYVSDAALLMRRADFSIFVVASGRTPKTIIKEAVRRIRNAGGLISGVALTKARRIPPHDYYAGYRAAAAPTGKRKSRKHETKCGIRSRWVST